MTIVTWLKKAFGLGTRPRDGDLCRVQIDSRADTNRHSLRTTVIDIQPAVMGLALRAEIRRFATVPVGTNPSAVTVNSVTNKVYIDVE
jgi:hypothetical protein